MNAFQILALGILLCLFIVTILAIARGIVSRRDGILWALLWLAAGIAMAFPELTVAAARRLGIGRGADLILYCAVVVMMTGFLMVYSRLRRLQREVTLLARHIAITEALDTAAHPGKSSSDVDKPGAGNEA